MRECGDCTACCTWIKGTAYGYEFGGGGSCKFLNCTGCGIHKVRPKVCENYFCAWAQELLPENMRPDLCGVIASVEDSEKGKYLRLSTTGSTINIEVLGYFKNWGEIMNTPVLYLKDNSWELL